MNDIEILEEIVQIGQGGVSKVYQCKIKNFENENIVVLKIGCDTKKNVINYNLIKSIKFSTLDYLEEGNYKGKLVIIAQHLNLSNRIYVTPNSILSNSFKLLQKLNPHISEKRSNKKNSDAENYRFQKKLSEITNFNDFIYSVIKELEFASTSKVYIEFDSYFIGSIRASSISEIDYKIADFDHIFEVKDKTYKEILSLNIIEFKRAMNGFIKHFVDDNENKKEYKKIISEIKNIA